MEEKGQPLFYLCKIEQGIVSGADRVTSRGDESTGEERGNIRLLPEWKIKQYDIKAGDGIFTLRKDEKSALDLSPKEEALVKPTYKNSAICPYFVDQDEELYIIYTTKKTNIDDLPNIKSHLEKFKEILEQKRECREGKLPWYSLHWARDENLLSTTKIVTPRWGEKELKPFGLQTGRFYESSDINLIVPKQGVKEDLLYILGVLNSEPIKRWMVEKGRQRGLTRQKVLEQIPIRRIDFNNPEDVQNHDAIVEKVKAIREKLAELAKYSRYFDGPRLPRLKFDEPLPPLKVEALLQELPEDKLHSLRTHPDIEIIKPKGFRGDEFRLQRVGKVKRTLEGPQLTLKGKDGQILTLAGPESLLELVAELLKARKGQSWEQIEEELLLPETISLLRDREDALLSRVEEIRREILCLQEEIDKIVCELYGLEEPS